MSTDTVVAKVIAEGSYYKAEFVVELDRFKSTVDTALYPTPRLAQKEAEKKAGHLNVELKWEHDIIAKAIVDTAEEQEEAEYRVLLVKSGRCKKRGFATAEDAKAWIANKNTPENYTVGRVQ